MSTNSWLDNWQVVVRPVGCAENQHEFLSDEKGATEKYHSAFLAGGGSVSLFVNGMLLEYREWFPEDIAYPES